MKFRRTYRMALFNSLLLLLATFRLESVYAQSPRRLRSRNAQQSSSAAASSNNPSYVLRWAASGGGWRAMTSHMAFANVFAQAGLLRSDSSSSQFDGISSNSGGSWFTTQLFYSSNFYQAVVSNSPSNLNQFITSWMDAYAQLQSNITSTNPECDIMGEYSSTLQIDAEACNILASYGSWADFIQAMLLATSTNAYNDPTFVNSNADSSNRVAGLTSTDLMIQMTLSQAAISNDDTISYISPSGTQVDGYAFSVPLAIQHTVQATSSSFRYGIPSGQLPLSVQWAEAPMILDIDHWSTYYLYPNTDGSSLTAPLSTTSVEGVTSLSPMFNGQTPTVTQVASGSSAAAGGFSGLNPATMVQALSLFKYYASTDIEKLEVDALGAFLYSNSLTNGLAMCDQWPTRSCGSSDGILIDGGYVDNNALAMNIGEYQTSVLNGATDDSTVSTLPTLKIIVTVANEPDDIDSDALLCSYFSTDFNQGVNPGDFVWPVVAGSTAVIEPFTYATPNPVLSLQIFQESMSVESLASLRQPIAGTNVTTAVISATTITNPAYGTVNGQRVDILYVETHVNIPTLIIGYNTTQYWTPYLASAANDIASVGSAELVQRIQDFLKL